MKTNIAKLSDPPILSIGDIPSLQAPQTHSIPNMHTSAEPSRTKSFEPVGSTTNPAQPAIPKQRWWLTLGILILIGGIGYFVLPRIRTTLGVQHSAPAAPPARVVPVVTASAARNDMKMYLNGLGTVTGYNTVTIRSRVEGELVKVAFTEGQLVKRDDLLAEIDSRPLQVQLDQAKARLAEAEAALQKAQHSQAREMAQAQLALDQSQLLLAREEERRMSGLVASKVITADDWDTAV